MPDLPIFRYHPDPLATGNVEPSNHPCDVCGVDRGFVYAGPVYSAVADEPTICPGASLMAQRRGCSKPTSPTLGQASLSEVPIEVVDEISHRTPGFSGWQQEHWIYHCGDAAAFMGRSGTTT